MSSALSELQAGLRVMDEIDECLRRHRETNDKAQSGEATKKLREVSVTLKSLAANPDAKSHDNMPLLIQLSKRMKDSVAQMKEIAGANGDATGAAAQPPASPVKANASAQRASVQLSAAESEPTSLPAPVIPANAPAVNGIPLEISGYLLKQGEKGLVRAWKKRWFTLRESRLYYYKAEDDSVPINFVDMRDAVVSDPGDPNKQNDFGLKFQLVVDKRVYRLKCLSLDDAKRWLLILQNATETYNAAVKKEKEKDKANARLSVRIVEKGTVDIAAAERDRIAAAERDRVAAIERDRVAAAERERAAAAAAAEHEREEAAAAQQSAADAEAAAVAAKAAPPPTPAKEAHDDAGVAARGAARHKATTDAPPPVVAHADASAAASASDDHGAAAQPEPHVEPPKKEKVVKQSVVGAWPVFEPVAPAAKTAAVAHATPHGAGKHVDSKALEKLEAELAAKDRELTKEKLVSAAATEQARVLTLERNDMKAEFGPLTQRLSKFEDEASQLRRALADQDAQLAAQAAEIKQLQASLTQVRQAQADGQRLVTQLTARVRDVESPKKPNKAKAADDRERIIEMALAHQEQCQLLEQELSRTKASTAARVQQLDEALRAARAEAGDLLQRYQQARQCSIALSNSDYVAGLEAELTNVRKELFYALAAATKLQCAMRGEVCNLPIDELYEKAQIDKLAVKAYPGFIAQATAAASPPLPSSPPSSSSSSAQLANARSPQMARRAQQKN